MSASRIALPPSARDFEIYRLIHLEQLSQRQTAARVQLSPTRVRQIVEKVGDYLGERLLATPGQPLEQQLLVAQLLASERVNHLYGEALRGFERSQKNKESLRRVTAEGKPTVLVETMQSTPGSCQFLNAAFRYATAAAKLPLNRLESFELDAELEAEGIADEVLEVGSPDGTPDVTYHPPVEDCAAKGETAVDSSVESPDADIANDCQSSSCDEVVDYVNGRAASSISPAHRAVATHLPIQNEPRGKTPQPVRKPLAMQKVSA